ncbi:uncharacterized protein PHACADRAFT_256844 [Phanerochaete carnosa HHB-10118-sp]|uniref:Uncharacterized protein n=1 Tax=Phanerochaete carnosa (strain HHB-10118-sp) TaxID=650164 RepID=K5W9P0_PHACS|nr:uncharacterized protein PHACADRAFT_256844 [Phanerochaete carnosa HHB-10118-sp]EKM55910.1 hypothetical protein PHACADRAFT_256844 [Phanerochaete carnosa HHB-10118-sp]
MSNRDLCMRKWINERIYAGHRDDKAMSQRSIQASIYKPHMIGLLSRVLVRPALRAGSQHHGYHIRSQLAVLSMRMLKQMCMAQKEGETHPDWPQVVGEHIHRGRTYAGTRDQVPEWH